MVQSWFRKLFWNQDCDVVGNLVVEIEIFNFCLFVCFHVCLYLTFCQFRKRKMVQLWFQKLFWNQDCDVVSNLVVEIAIYNFDLFHTALFGKDKPCVYSRRTKHTPQQWWSNGGCRTKSHRQQDHTMTLGPHLGKIPNNRHHTFSGEIANSTHSHIWKTSLFKPTWIL